MTWRQAPGSWGDGLLHCACDWNQPGLQPCKTGWGGHASLLCLPSPFPHPHSIRLPHFRP